MYPSIKRKKNFFLMHHFPVPLQEHNLGTLSKPSSFWKKRALQAHLPGPLSTCYYYLITLGLNLRESQLSLFVIEQACCLQRVL